MILNRGFRYRIYPTAEQAARLDRWSDALRFLWNLAHEQRLMGYAHQRGFRHYPTFFSQSKELTGLRAELPWLGDVPHNIASRLLGDLDDAWLRCFKQIDGTPKWKCKGRDVLGLTEPHPSQFHLKGNTLKFPKIGPLRVVVHRPLEGVPRTCTIKRDGDQWFCSIVCEIEIADPAPSNKPPIGIDRGCVNLLTDSNGRIVENPRHLRKAEQRMARADRTVSRRKKGSKNRARAIARLNRIHRKVRRQREHVLHCESKRYADNQGIIFVEKLQIQNMSAKRGTYKRGLNQSIMSAGWGRLVEFFRYKVAPLGGSVGEVIAAGTSITCTRCGKVDKASRVSQSNFHCTGCGHEEHADTNAAKNILHRGLTAVEPTVAVCGGFAEARRPAKQKLRVARRGIRSQGLPLDGVGLHIGPKTKGGGRR